MRSDKTDQIDAQLRALQWYYNALAAEGADSRALDPVLAVMEKLDNARRAEVFTVLDRRLSALQDSERWRLSTRFSRRSGTASMRLRRV